MLSPTSLEQVWTLRYVHPINSHLPVLTVEECLRRKLPTETRCCCSCCLGCCCYDTQNGNFWGCCSKNHHAASGCVCSIFTVLFIQEMQISFDVISRYLHVLGVLSNFAQSEKRLEKILYHSDSVFAIFLICVFP